MQKEIADKVLLLLEQQQSLLLSTLSIQSDGLPSQPYTSYAPYFCDVEQQVFYLFLSDLSEHSHYLRTNPNASILIIEDEAESEKIFARVRVQYQVVGQVLDDHQEKSRIIEAMKRRFGEIVDVLSSLADFRVFKLEPQNGRYIEGFGRAFTIKQGLTEEITPVMQDKMK